MFLILLLLCACVADSGEFTRKTKDIAQKTLVIKGTENGQVVGSGFAFERDGQLYVTTARHVALSSLLMTGPEMFFCSSLYQNECIAVSVLRGYTYISEMPSLDTIVWRVEKLPGSSKASRTDCGSKIGEKVYASGAPFGRAPDISQGYITWKAGGLTVHDARTAPGSSGGPVFSEKGRVVAQSVAVEISGEANVSSSSVAVDICTVTDLVH